MSETNEQTHISINTPEGYPLEITKEDLSEFDVEGLNVKTSKYKVQAYAAMDWITPEIVIAFVASTYFQGFLKEAGKEHFHSVKNGFKKLIKKFITLDVKTITSKGAVDKIDSGYNQSKAISITFQSKGDRRIKLLFDRTLEQSDWESAIDQVFEIMIDNYKNHPNDKLTEEIKGLQQHKNFTIYALIDKNTKKITFYDDMKLLIDSKS